MAYFYSYCWTPGLLISELKVSLASDPNLSSSYSCPFPGYLQPQFPRQAMVWVADILWLWDHGNVLCHPITSFFHPQGSLNISRPLRFPRAPHYYVCRKFNNSPFIKQSSLFRFWTTNSLLFCLWFSKVLLISLLKQSFYFGSPF